MSAAAIRAARADDRELLDAGLAIAARDRELTFVALPAPPVRVAVLVDAMHGAPVVAWSTSELACAGIGIARELRGRGEQRWQQVIEAARFDVGAAVVDGERFELRRADARRTATDDHHPLLVQPRLFGGVAFAPGAADRAPWVGFGDAWFVLPRWTYVSDGASAQLVLAVDGAEAVETARWHSELAMLRAAFAAATVAPGQPPVLELAPASADDWRVQVTSITDAIARGACRKVVAARTLGIAFAGEVRPAALLAALDERQPECVRVMIRPPRAGALIAATPERLVKKAGNGVACDALAGTRRIGAGDRAEAIAAATRELVASAKDRREHDLVVDAIHTALGGIADVDAPREPIVRVLRDVVHLHTPFRATLHADAHVLALAARLHPTPAVGGTPADVASDWIRTHEPVARGWYAAPVGWFDLAGDGELAVAIRSGLVAGNRAHLWAGAGIVAGSDPERELAETEIKLHALLGALR